MKYITHPKITIVTPNFNGAKYLEETILSVFEQNYPNLEYIIIDGGSTDGSLEIIRKYDKKLTLWISEPDEGMYHAIQKGFDRSTGEIMAWINSDDKYHPGSLSIVSEIFEKYPEVSWLTGSITQFDVYGRTIRVFQTQKWSKYDYYTGNYGWIQQESTFWRRGLWEKSGGKFNLEIKYAADFELWLRFFRYDKLHITTSLIGGFRVREADQISFSYSGAYIKEAEDLLKAEKLNSREKAVVNMVKVINSISKLFWYVKLNMVSNIIRRGLTKPLRVLFYDYPPEIYFDRFLQEFVIKEYTDKK
jgi:glycosyltransferase involved in cell wall biosynthesis